MPRLSVTAVSLLYGIVVGVSVQLHFYGIAACMAMVVLVMIAFVLAYIADNG